MTPWRGRRVGEGCLVGWPCQTQDSGCRGWGSSLPPSPALTHGPRLTTRPTTGRKVTGNLDLGPLSLRLYSPLSPPRRLLGSGRRVPYQLYLLQAQFRGSPPSPVAHDPLVSPGRLPTLSWAPPERFLRGSQPHSKGREGGNKRHEALPRGRLRPCLILTATPGGRVGTIPISQTRAQRHRETLGRSHSSQVAGPGGRTQTKTMSSRIHNLNHHTDHQV